MTDEKCITKIFNENFTSIIKHLHIERKEFDSKNVKLSNNAVLSAVNKFQNHPSILKIKITFLVKDINTCIRKVEFCDKLKTADITPTFKKGDKHGKSNYSYTLSKVYEKCLYKQIENYMENILSNFQCGFRKGSNAQQCLIGIVEKVKRIMDKGGHFSASLTDLSNAFDCLPHDLLIAKLDAYGFKNDALLVFNYLSNRKQRVKIDSSFSSFQYIIGEVPEGSLLGPLLFNIFHTDIFIFCPTEIASYTDDNTP